MNNNKKTKKEKIIENELMGYEFKCPRCGTENSIRLHGNYFATDDDMIMYASCTCGRDSEEDDLVIVLLGNRKEDKIYHQVNYFTGKIIGKGK